MQQASKINSEVHWRHNFGRLQKERHFSQSVGEKREGYNLKDLTCRGVTPEVSSPATASYGHIYYPVWFEKSVINDTARGTFGAYNARPSQNAQGKP